MSVKVALLLLSQMQPAEKSATVAGANVVKANQALDAATAPASSALKSTAPHVMRCRHDEVAVLRTNGEPMLVTPTKDDLATLFPVLATRWVANAKLDDDDNSAFCEPTHAMITRQRCHANVLDPIAETASVLNRRLTFACDDNRLENVAAQLSKQLRVVILVTEPDDDTHARLAARRVTLTAVSRSLREILVELTRQANCHYAITEQGVELQRTSRIDSRATWAGICGQTRLTIDYDIAQTNGSPFEAIELLQETVPSASMMRSILRSGDSQELLLVARVTATLAEHERLIAALDATIAPEPAATPRPMTRDPSRQLLGYTREEGTDTDNQPEEPRFPAVWTQLPETSISGFDWGPFNVPADD